MIDYLMLATGSFFQWSRRSPAGLNVRRCVTMLAFSVVFFPWLLGNTVALALDPLLFDFRRIEPRTPFFIVGIPRSGTTFLHRLISLDKEQFTTMPLWEILLAPSLIQKYFWWGMYVCDQKIGGPGYALIRWIEKRVFGSLDAIHQTSLFEPEEDYLSLIPIGGCFLMVHPFPNSARIWELTRFDELSQPRQRRLMHFYRQIVQRHLYFRGDDKCYLAKNPSFTPMIDALVETFPGAAIAACRRTPVEVVPSLLNSMKSGALWFGNSTTDAHFRDRYVAVLQYYFGVLRRDANRTGRLESNSAIIKSPTQEDGESSRTESRVKIVEYSDLTTDPDQVALALFEQFGFNVNPAFSDSLNVATQEAKTYRSRHDYSLESFGLNESLVRDLFPTEFDSKAP